MTKLQHGMAPELTGSRSPSFSFRNVSLLFPLPLCLTSYPRTDFSLPVALEVLMYQHRLNTGRGLHSLCPEPGKSSLHVHLL